MNTKHIEFTLSSGLTVSYKGTPNQYELTAPIERVDVERAFKELLLEIDRLRTQQDNGKDYRHTKTGNIYRVIGEVINATNGDQDGQEMVLYERNGGTYVREAAEFRDRFIPLQQEGES